MVNWVLISKLGDFTIKLGDFTTNFTTNLITIRNGGEKFDVQSDLTNTVT
jgi:hypothetical protein